jgi:hypothetical protein
MFVFTYTHFVEKKFKNNLITIMSKTNKTNKQTVISMKSKFSLFDYDVKSCSEARVQEIQSMPDLIPSVRASVIHSTVADKSSV